MKILNKIAISTMIILSSITAVNAEYFIKSNFQAGMIQQNTVEEPTIAFTATRTYGSVPSVQTSVTVKVIDESKFDSGIYPRQFLFSETPQVSAPSTAQSSVYHAFTPVENQTIASNVVNTSSNEDHVYTITYPNRGVEVTYTSKGWKESVNFTTHYTINIVE